MFNIYCIQYIIHILQIVHILHIMYIVHIVHILHMLHAYLACITYVYLACITYVAYVIHAIFSMYYICCIYMYILPILLLCPATGALEMLLLQRRLAAGLLRLQAGPGGAPG